MKTKDDFLIFHEVSPLLFTEKVERFSEHFFKDYTAIMELKIDDEVKKCIESLDDRKRKILVDDTYFSIIQGRLVSS